MIENKLYIGIDNGVSGTIGVLLNNKSWFFKTPIKKEQNYTKAKANISRIDFGILRQTLHDILTCNDFGSIKCLIERPMVNPGRFKATTSALRSLEATLIILETLDIPIEYIDSKKWQKELLPSGSSKENLKKDSSDIGIRLFPEFKEKILNHKDADGILIAEYARRNF